MRRWRFVPGMACRATIWEEASRWLPEVGVRCVDWPRPERIYSMDDAAGWRAEEVDIHDPEVVVAHSFGGTAARHLFGLLGHRPTRRIVAVDSFVPSSPPLFHAPIWARRRCCLRGSGR